jgi:hypothetical protein
MNKGCRARRRPANRMSFIKAARRVMCALMILKHGLRTVMEMSEPEAPAAMKSAQAFDARSRMASVSAIPSSSPAQSEV